MLIGSAGLAVIYLLIGMLLLCRNEWLDNVNTGNDGNCLLCHVISPHCMGSIYPKYFHNRFVEQLWLSLPSSLWIASFILTYSFPLLNESLQAAGTFWLYGGICLTGISFFIVDPVLPETKGKSLEDIEKEITKK